MSKNSSDRRSPASRLLWLLVLVSLLLNVVVLGQILMLRRSAGAALSQASLLLGDLRAETLELTIPIEETIIIDTDFPVDESVTVPIETEVPIDTTVTVNVDAGVLGEIPVKIPVETTIPVDLETTVDIDQTFAVRAPVELALEIPVAIVVADTPLYDMLGDAQVALDAAAADMKSPFPRR